MYVLLSRHVYSCVYMPNIYKYITVSLFIQEISSKKSIEHICM